MLFSDRIGTRIVMANTKFLLGNVALCLLLALGLSGCNKEPIAADKAPADTRTSKVGTTPVDRALIVHMFNWAFADITRELPRLKQIGYNHILVSPPNLTINNRQWWGRYQPVDYRVIDGPLGDQKAFEALIAAASTQGIRIIVDVPFNHMANPGIMAQQNEDFDSEKLVYPPISVQQKYPQIDGPLFDASNFHDAQCIDWGSHGRWEQDKVVHDVRNHRMCGGEGDVGMPDLVQGDPKVLATQQAYLKRLVALGVGGYRFDAIKHMEPSYASALLVEGTLPPDALVFGEIIAGSKDWARDIAPYWEQSPEYYRFYDFPLIKTMHAAFNGEGLAQLGGDLVSGHQAMPAHKAVTFVVNHDIPQNGWIFADMLFGGDQGAFSGAGANFGDPEIEKLAYALVLGREAGIPMVYTDLGRSSESDIKSSAYKDAYCDATVIRMLGFRRLVGDAPEVALKTNDAQHMIAFQRGKAGLVVVNKGHQGVSLGSAIGETLALGDGEYVDLLSEKIVTVAKGKISSDFQLEAFSAAMFVNEERSYGVFEKARSAACPRPETDALWANYECQLGSPDVQVESFATQNICSTGDSADVQSQDLVARVINAGRGVGLAPGMDVIFLDGAGRKLGTVKTTQELYPGEGEEIRLSLTVNDQQKLSAAHGFRVQVSVANDCRANNNSKEIAAAVTAPKCK